MKVQPAYDVSTVKQWARDILKDRGRDRPHWRRFQSINLHMVAMPSPSWHLKLVNIQRHTRSHRWDLPRLAGHIAPDHHHPSQSANVFRSIAPAQPHANRLCLSELIRPPPKRPPLPSLVRIAANSKTPVRQFEHDSDAKQLQFCTDWLRGAGVNHDLVPSRTPPPSHLRASHTKSRASHGRIPASQEQDLFSCSFENKAVYNVEDKDPSVLWRINDAKVFDLWFCSFLRASTR